MTPEELDDLYEELKDEDASRLGDLVTEARMSYQAGDTAISRAEDAIREMRPDLTEEEVDLLLDRCNDEAWEF